MYRNLKTAPEILEIPMSRKKIDFDVAQLKEIPILYVEDEEGVHENILEFLQLYFDQVYSAYNGKEGLELFHRHQPEIVLTDIRMPLMDGLEMAEEIKTLKPETPIIVLSAYYEPDLLHRSIDIGIDKYVRKPTDGESLLSDIYKAALPLFQKREIDQLSQKIYTSIETRLSRCDTMMDVIKGIRKVAKSDFSVIIQGETGVGKSYAARIIHDLSRRSEKPFITVDISTIPETLVESELFGHTKGAFTGANRDRKGFFEIAHGGTLFLEELENMSPFVQTKLLRAVEERSIYPVGSTKPVNIDIRIISASNRNLLEDVKNNKFREDLYYRLCEFDIHIPPLRQRPEDIVWLTHKFAGEVASELDRNYTGITSGSMELLKLHAWNGNVRELKNAVRRMVLMSEGSTITEHDVARIIRKPHVGDNNAAQSVPVDFALTDAVEEAERTAILRALKETNGKKVKAASLLRIDFKTLTAKMEKFNISSRVSHADES